MFNLAIDSKLRDCDRVGVRVCDVIRGDRGLSQAMIVKKKTKRPVQFELTEPKKRGVGVARKDSSAQRSVPISEQGPESTVSLNTPVCADRSLA